MPSLNLRPNRNDSEEYVTVDIEANAKDEETPAALFFGLTHEDDSVEVFETDADEIRSFRDAVVAECDKAIAHIEAS